MEIDQKIKNELKNIVGKDRFFDNLEEKICYSYDAASFQFKPDVVLKPQNADQVSRILKLAYKNNIYVTPRGSGTGLTGGSVPVKGGIVLVLTDMDKIIETDQDNLTATVEPGVVNEVFKNHIEKLGLFYPPDPASQSVCTLGGNIAENAGGPHCLKYGTTRDYVLGLEVVLSDGEIINTGGCVIKNVSGYDLTRLIIGSEGTLGVVTKIILQLIPLPSEKRTITAFFSSVEQASITVSEIIKAKIIPATLEFMDQTTIRCVEEYLKLGLPQEAEALLLIETDGDKEVVEKEILQIENICQKFGAYQIKRADSSAERDNLWKARKSIAPALGRVAPLSLVEDIVVPRSRLTDMINKTNQTKQKYGIETATFGHAGDGNLHVNLLLKDRNPETLKQAELVLDFLYSETMNLKGTISGEHGIGFLKSKYLPKEAKNAVLIMKKIKDTLDPKGILNPGKIF